jgi:hypothetical protein
LSIFQRFYESSYQQPGALWFFLAVGLISVLLTLRDRPVTPLSRYGFVLIGLSALDAGLTSNWAQSELPSLSQGLSIFFVWMGDFRHFLLGEWLGHRNLSKGVVLRAILVASIVPIFAFGLSRFLPSSWPMPRSLFLSYEVLFVIVSGAWAYSLDRRYLMSGLGFWRIQTFFVATYLLWITADVLILMGLSGPGFALRVVPNLLYYSVYPVLITCAALGECKLLSGAQKNSL